MNRAIPYPANKHSGNEEEGSFETSIAEKFSGPVSGDAIVQRLRRGNASERRIEQVSKEGGCDEERDNKGAQDDTCFCFHVEDNR